MRYARRHKPTREMPRQQYPSLSGHSNLNHRDIQNRIKSVGMIQTDGLYYRPMPDISTMEFPAFSGIGDMHAFRGFMTAENFRQQTPDAPERRLELPYPDAPTPVLTYQAVQVGDKDSI